jgi:tetratricopeptide (TPR) repeat protein
LFPSAPDAEFARGAELLKRGDLLEAERALLRTLEAAPEHVGAHYLLGLIALRRGAFEDAERSLARALAINPKLASAHRQRGLALAQMGRAVEALESFSAALALEPDNAEAFAQRANALQELGRFEDALSDYDRAIALAPGLAPFHNNRGLALCRVERFEEALASFDRALALNPSYALAHKNRGDVLSALNRLTEALAGYDRAIALGGSSGVVLNNRGNVLKEFDRLDEALASYDAAIAVSPQLPEAWYNRGVVLLELKRPTDALASYDRAIALKADYDEALTARGLCKLAMGEFKGGWSDYESRWRVASHPKLHAPTDAPLWSGEDVRDRSILVCAERGLGDIIQFSRFVPRLAERGAQVTFVVPDKLKRIFGSLPVRAVSAVTDSDRFDFHCALMSLPHVLGASPTGNPLPIPYLAIDRERAAQWKRRIGAHGFKIGICWQGAAWQGGTSTTGRAIPLSEFRALSTNGVRLVSLQKGDGVERLATSGVSIERLGDDFDAGPDAFIDTIAVMEQLDLIVTCDTSIAHVAGARGRPVWIALPHVPEWRWGLEGGTTSWYPTARLFRQRTRGDWSGVFIETASELRALMR